MNNRKLIVKDNGNSDYALPTAGNVSAVCVDVVDLGEKETTFGLKHQIDIVWEINEDFPNGEGRFFVRKRYTPSLNPKSNLSKDLVAWRGQAFTAEELEAFNLENIIGAPCLLNIVHRESGGRTYANANTVTPLPNGMAPLKASDSYTRILDRENSWDVRSPHYSPDRESKPRADQYAEAKQQDGLPFDDKAALQQAPF